MHICFISGEIFAFGKYGGFGRATRVIGAGLAERGHQVSAIVPRRKEQPPMVELDGIQVHSFSKWNLLKAAQLYRLIDADVYHSQEPSLGTWIAQLVRPHAKHVVTCRDPRDAQDWAIEEAHATMSRWATKRTRVYEYNPLVCRAVQQADSVFGAAQDVAKKAQRLYGLAETPAWLPTPVLVPEKVEKAKQPTVCFLSRWDPRKRPELFFKLASRFPAVQFVAAGLAHDLSRDAALRKAFSGVDNLKLEPFLDQFSNVAHEELLSRSWILVNTALREGLPNSFIEAAAHGCALLSGVDPDGFCSRFGEAVVGDQFEAGLNKLLEGDRWRALGERGRGYVLKHYELRKALNQHEQIYKALV